MSPEPHLDGAPHLLFIVLDDVGFADLGCYGSEIATPNMDRLASAGLRYSNFHTTGVCSPTRASLLTGRNPHAVGMGSIAEWATGFAGYQGRVSNRAATLAEMIRPHGYNCMAVGKWHLMPSFEATAAGPFHSWPLSRGFDRWYGFHGALTDQWHPELFEDNHAIDRPDRPGYHLSEDLVDRAKALVSDQQSAAPGKPFFLYLAFGACHWPLHVPRALIERYRHRYDDGWDAIRAARFARQRELGIIADDVELAPPNPGVRPWAALSTEERRLAARQMEVYAAFVEHTDVQVGRMLDHLEAMGLLEETAVVLLSDNGATPEGGQWGAVNGRKHLMSEPETLEDGLAAMDRLGDPTTFSIYAAGWAQAGNTPLKWYKKDTHGGGVRDPLIICWPGRTNDAGGVRSQYHHVIDIVPTVLELLGIEAPETHQGVEQLPIHGVSMAYTFDRPEAPTARHTQAFELLGDRAIWHNGWKAVAKHVQGEEFDDDRWELYHLERDFSECHDLADANPTKLREMIERWWAEAARFDMLPLDDREFARAAANVAARARRTYTYDPGMSRIDRTRGPDITDRSHRIAAEVDIPSEGASGVLLTAGSRFAGYVMYLDGEGHLCYEYSFSERIRHRARAPRPVPPGRQTFEYRFTRTGPRCGTGSLWIDGVEVASVDIPKTWPVITMTGGVHCGRDGGNPVSDAYTPPFPFTGTLHRVRVEVGADGTTDPNATLRADLAEQ